mgnify:CR=1 FL=1
MSFFVVFPCCFVQNIVYNGSIDLAAALSVSSLGSSVEVNIGSLLLWTSLSLRNESVFYASGNSDERLVDVDVVLGRAFPERHVEFIRKFLSFFRGNNLFVEHIALVSNQDLVDVDIRVLLDL